MSRRNIEVNTRLIDQRYQTLRTFIRCLFGFGLAYFGFKAIQSLSGETTSVIVDGSLKVLGDIHVVVPYALAAALGGWGFGERKLRHRKTAELQDRIKHLETSVDPKRTSSQLTRQGKTNPKDRRP